MTSILLAAVAVTAALPVAPLAAEGEGRFGLAPDGAREFGAVDGRDIEKMFRDATEDAATLLLELRELQQTVDLLVLETLRSYEERGYFHLVEDGPRLVDLHRRFDALEASPFLRPLEKPAAEALVRMFADSRFRVRRHVLAGVELEQRELRGAMTLFQAHSRGVAGLDPGEVERLAARADLAARVLRAVRTDLRLLQDPREPEPVRNPEAMAKLTRALVEGDRTARPFFDQWNVRWRGLDQRMLLDLETTRFPRSLNELRVKRDEGLRQSTAHLREISALLPKREGDGADDRPDLAALKDSERYRLAIRTGLEALRLDPFSPELHLAVADAYDFLQGRPFSRLYYDRYLALRGIRSYDHETLRDRDLSAAEDRALTAVLTWIAETTPLVAPRGH